MSNSLPVFFSKLFAKKKFDNPETAYNTWSENYDSQPGNMMLAWDEMIFSELLGLIDVKNKMIADIGCGTGRHWQKIFERHPLRLVGFDISEGMLQKLIQKFPGAETHLLKGNKLTGLHEYLFDGIISTLTIAHIRDAKEALAEWAGIIKPGGFIIITDYHPYALASGGKRTFKYKNKTVAIRNYVHSIDDISKLAGQLGLQISRLVEKVIDESAFVYYEKQDATRLYEKWKGTPVIYGMLLKKENATMQSENSRE